VGGLVVMFKGLGLLAESHAMRPDQAWPWAAATFGVLAGGLRAKTVFGSNCRRNLDRIAALESPKIWQFFRPRFFLLLVLMIAAGAILSRFAHRSYALLIATATLELGIAVALLGSAHLYWRQ